MKPTDGHDPQHTPAHTSKACALCGTLRHPAQAAQGRKLTKHLAANPFPRQAATA